MLPSLYRLDRVKYKWFRIKHFLIYLWLIISAKGLSWRIGQLHFALYRNDTEHYNFLRSVPSLSLFNTRTYVYSILNTKTLGDFKQIYCTFPFYFIKRILIIVKLVETTKLLNHFWSCYNKCTFYYNLLAM